MLSLTMGMVYDSDGADNNGYDGYNDGDGDGGGEDDDPEYDGVYMLMMTTLIMMSILMMTMMR